MTCVQNALPLQILSNDKAKLFYIHNGYWKSNTKAMYKNVANKQLYPKFDSQQRKDDILLLVVH